MNSNLLVDADLSLLDEAATNVTRNESLNSPLNDAFDDTLDIPSDLSELSFMVSVEAGQVMLTIKQLLLLRSGQTFEIGALPLEVKLSVNNVVIARGYLVEINGRVGVKITELTSKQINVSA